MSRRRERLDIDPTLSDQQFKVQLANELHGIPIRLCALKAEIRSRLGEVAVLERRLYDIKALLCEEALLYEKGDHDDR